jgi:hypothetical protein
MPVELEYPELLTIARLAHKRMNELQALISRYERFSEDNDSWIEKIAECRGQYQIMKDVYDRMCYLVATLKIQENESEGI